MPADTEFTFDGVLFPQDPPPADPPAPPDPGAPPQSQEQAPPPVVPPSEPPANPEPPADQEPPAEPKTKEPTGSSRTPYANLAMSFREIDNFLPMDMQIPDDLDGPGLKALLLEVAEKKAAEKISLDDVAEREKQKLIDKGWTAEQVEEAMERSELMASGLTAEEARLAQHYGAWAEYAPETPEQKLAKIKQAYLVAGQAEALVDSFLKTNFSDLENPDVVNQIDALSKEASAFFDKYRQDLVAAGAQRQQAQKEEQEQKVKEEREAVVKAMANGFFGIKPTKDEMKELEKAMFEVESYEVVEGNRVPLTKETKAWREIMASPEKRAFMAYIAVMGPEKFASMVNKKTTDSFLSAISETEKPTAPAASEAPVFRSTDDRARVSSGDIIMTIPF